MRVARDAATLGIRLGLKALEHIVWLAGYYADRRHAARTRWL